jgi:serine/threonine protein kinase
MTGCLRIGTGRHEDGRSCTALICSELTLLLRHQSDLDPGRKRDLLVDVVRGMISLHAQKIIHGDLKPKNILITSDFPPRAKVCDFGFAKLATDIDQTSSRRGGGTALYNPPELYQDVLGPAPGVKPTPLDAKVLEFSLVVRSVQS